MTRRRVIKSALANFVGTYVSRYSDYRGFWLFGFLVDGPPELRIDLLENAANSSNIAVETARKYATEKFAKQCEKAGVAPAHISEAWLTITRLPGRVRGPVNGRSSDGCNVKFAAAAITDQGRRYNAERVVFVAPHDPTIEQRSARAAGLGTP